MNHELHEEERELRERLKDSSGEQTDRITEELHRVRRQLQVPDGPQLLTDDLKKIIARTLDGWLG